MLLGVITFLSINIRSIIDEVAEGLRFSVKKNRGTLTYFFVISFSRRSMTVLLTCAAAALHIRIENGNGQEIENRGSRTRTIIDR